MTSVLVVDDNAMNRLVVKHLCRHLGLDFREAPSGEVALNLTLHESFDVILMDLNMPSLSGEETLAKLDARSFGRRPPVVAYSAHTQGDDADRLTGLGFNALLVKPISIDSFQLALERCGIRAATPR